jgi:hypothetical protein
VIVASLRPPSRPTTSRRHRVEAWRRNVRTVRSTLSIVRDGRCGHDRNQARIDVLAASCLAAVNCDDVAAGS